MRADAGGRHRRGALPDPGPGERVAVRRMSVVGAGTGRSSPAGRGPPAGDGEGSYTGRGGMLRVVVQASSLLTIRSRLEACTTRTLRSGPRSVYASRPAPR